MLRHAQTDSLHALKRQPGRKRRLDRADRISCKGKTFVKLSITRNQGAAYSRVVSLDKLRGSKVGTGPVTIYDQGPETSVADNDLGKSSCIACHRISAITPKFVNHPGEKGWWTDYSTLFFKAQVKRAPLTRKRR